MARGVPDPEAHGDQWEGGNLHPSLCHDGFATPLFTRRARALQPSPASPVPDARAKRP